MLSDFRSGLTTSVPYTTSNSTAGPTLGAQTDRIRVVANSACHLRIGAGAQTATTSDPFIPANWECFFSVTRGQATAVLVSPTNGLVTSTSGTVWITEGV